MSEAFSTPAAPKAIGPYSQAVRSGSLLFTSGQLPLDPATGRLVGGGIAEQTRQVMANLQAILTAAETDWARVVKVTVFMTDLAQFAEFNRTYAAHFASSPPARSTVQVAALPLGAGIEIEMVAELP
jgi:2-iminobutanoate/2-iminopropanoate deaminase